MSEHAIEDLVEDSVRLVLGMNMAAPAKREMIGELYAFRAYYDTSDTTGRFVDELRAIGYDDEARPRRRAWPEIVADIVAIADNAGARQLVHHWLGMFATEIDNLTLLDEGLQEDFPAFFNRPAATAIRETAIRNEVYSWRGKAGYVRLPTYRSIADSYEKFDPKTVDLRTMLRFLLDHKSDPARITSDYAKELKTIARMADSPLFSLPEMVESRGPFRLANRSASDDRHVFVFEAQTETDYPDGSRLLLVIEHLRDFNVLYLKKAVRSGLLARWQNRSFDEDDTGVHFSRGMSHFVPQAKLDADKHLNGMGWRYRMDQSAKVLGQRLDAILSYWHHGRKMEEFHRGSLAELIDREGFAGLNEQRLKRHERFGFFADEVDLLFACACRSWDQNIRPDVEIAAIETSLRHMRQGMPGRAERIALVDKLRSGPAFPWDLMSVPVRRHEDAFPLQDEKE